MRTLVPSPTAGDAAAADLLDRLAELDETTRRDLLAIFIRLANDAGRQSSPTRCGEVQS